MIETCKKLLFVSRPVSWLNTAYPFAVGYLLSGGVVDELFIIGTLYFLIPYNLLMYGINDVFDYESDKRNPRKGSIEGANAQPAFHSTILWAAAASNLPFVIWLTIQGWGVSALVLAGLIFFVIAYSLKYLRFKEIPGLDSITSSIHFVGPLVFALVLHGFTPEAAPYIAAFFLWGMASHAFGAVQDIMPDRQGGLASIATVLGAKYTTRLVLVLYLISAGLVIMQGFPAAVAGLLGLLYALNVLPYIKLDDHHSAQAHRGWRRLIWLNFLAGFVITITLSIQYITWNPFHISFRTQTKYFLSEKP